MNLGQGKSKLMFRGEKRKSLVRIFCEMIAFYPEGWHEVIRVPGLVLALSEGEHPRNLEVHLPPDWRTYFPDGLGAHFSSRLVTPVPKVAKKVWFTGKGSYFVGCFVSFVGGISFMVVLSGLIALMS